MPFTVSVITAVYNRAGTVAQALASVHEQTWPHIEHVVIDGASTDGTLDVLRRYKDDIDVLVSERDNGIYDALNKGLSRASGDAVGFLHSDDFFANAHALEHIANAFTDPNVDIVFADLDYVAKVETSTIVRKWRCGPYSRSALAQGWMPPHPTFYVRRGLIQELGGFDVSMPLAADYDFMMRYLLRAGGRARYLPEVLIKMRLGGASNRSLGAVVQNARENMRALRKNGVGGYRTLVLNKLRKLSQFW